MSREQNTEILTNHSKSAIANSIEANIVQWIDRDWHLIKRPHDVEIEVSDDLVRCYTGVPSLILNCVYRAQFDEKEAESKVSEFIDYYRKRQTRFGWWVGPTSSPHTLGKVLEAQGLTRDEFPFPAMALDLRKISPSMLLKATQRSGGEVVRVQSEEDVQKWHEGFKSMPGYGENTADAWRDTMLPHLESGEKAGLVGYYLAIDDEPVGFSQVAYAAGVAGIYNVATKKEHRRKGIGTAITYAPLLDAHKRGYEIGVLEASEPGYEVYSRMGFETYYKYEFYYMMHEDGNS